MSEGPWNAHPFYVHPCCFFLEAKPYVNMLYCVCVCVSYEGMFCINLDVCACVIFSLMCVKLHRRQKHEFL